MACCSATRKISLRIAGANFIVACRNNCDFSSGGAPEISARATSIPSAEVPDITPSTSVERLRGRVVIEFVSSVRTADSARRWVLVDRGPLRGVYREFGDRAG